MVSQPKRLVPIVALQNEYVVKIDLARNGCEAQVCTQKTGASLYHQYHPFCLDHALKPRPLYL